MNINNVDEQSGILSFNTIQNSQNKNESNTISISLKEISYVQSKYHPDFNFSLLILVVSSGLTYCLVISSPHLISVVARTEHE